MIVEKVIELKKSRIKQWPVHSNRASELGHECIRYLVFQRTRWQDRTLHDVNLQMIFDEGNVQERAIIRDLEDAGFDLIEQQKPFDWIRYNITGHLDAKIIIDGKAIPLEIKSMSPYVYRVINSIDDMKNAKYHHLRMYPSQLNLYCLMDNKEFAYFLLKNKGTGQLKEIRMDIDYDLGEKLLQKAEAINLHVNKGTVPNCIEYRDDICGSCGYLHVCLPEVKRTEIEFRYDPELVEKLDRWNELKPYQTEYAKIDKEIKSAFNRLEKAIIGDYLVQGKEVKRQAYNVKEQRFWKVNISKIGESDNAE